MPKNIDQIIQEQLGGLVFALCVKDAELERLREELKQLKEQLDAKSENK